jgi:hypothetical protein
MIGANRIVELCRHVASLVQAQLLKVVADGAHRLDVLLADLTRAQQLCLFFRYDLQEFGNGIYVIESK